ncbi:HlyD family efflux transporter periplasmic adaptor subunit [Nitrosomonas sp.]|uniref:HlyD family efflux transporter periplasmic adaptor subunit n=1 Tax=Nitrosomonas sp. TaxID=42353 RepID=UPI0025EC82D4|nr:HlyD family efflux transporter periplasmic adaptor subunit [Nitrosomonas sp.]MBY0485524.1 HlyD family efflux transporter periplasmic adaptor subunit [Nitrosomonas sp.]
MISDGILELPQLREDIQISIAPNSYDGSKNWTIYDPVNNRFYRVGALVYQMLSNWVLGNSRDLIQYIESNTTFLPTQEDVSELIGFLSTNQLTIQSCSQQFDYYLRQHQASHKNFLQRILRHYLFFRVPLFRPDVFLNRTYPFIKKFYSKTFIYSALLVALLGVYFVSRQWDIFVNTFLHFFTLKGAFVYLLALIGTKIIHELGHAYTAKYYGCRVPSIGIAFMVMIPMLYSDMSDTWRLNDKKQRIHVAAAGIINELLLVGVCLFIWAFLPDGMLRSVCFIVATTSIISSLVINLTPFMRFDGYYILSDWWGTENLQQRSFLLAQWKLRQLLFGGIEDKPEHFSPDLELKLVCYAWTTWFYRLLLYLGIALLVYHFFFKMLGLILFIIEIFYFIVMPVYKELKRWWILKSQIQQNTRIKLWFLSLIIVIGLLLFPWNSKIYLPGLLTSANYASIYSPESAQIISIDIERGQKVEKDQVLMVLRSPLIESEIELTQKQLALLKLRAARAVTNRQDQDDLQVILEQIVLESGKLEGLEKRQARLILRAPFSGVVSEMDHSLRSQQWLSNMTPLFFIIDSEVAEIKGIVPVSELNRIEIGQTATFYPEDPQMPKVVASISRIDWGNIKNLDLTYLSSQYGGEVAVKNHKDGKSIPENTAYAIKLSNILSAVPSREIRGNIRIEGQSVFLIKRLYDLVLSVIIRESGF